MRFFDTLRRNIRKHMKLHLSGKHKKLIGIGALLIVLGGGAAFVYWRIQKSKTASLVPSSGPEGTEVTLAYPKAIGFYPQQATMKFYDASEHGFYAVNNGAASYVAYDPTKGLSYSAQATAVATDQKRASYMAAVPQGICGLIIQSSQQPNPPAKVLQVSLVGPDGKEIPGMKPAKFKLKCDKYTLSIKVKTSKDPVLPDGQDQATISATLTVKGPAQFINGKRVGPTDPKIMIVSPLAFVMTHFDTNLGVLVPSPSNVKTDVSGTATVTLSSPDAGIATVRAIAQGIGDASVKVHFPPKIMGVSENFVQPNSPTNYQLVTTPANAKDLNFAWSMAPNSCGYFTGAASGMGESKNGFYHGPTPGNSDGCAQAYEMGVQVTVTVTDKDNQSDTRTFSARGLEGQGLVNFK